jgi:hypothetical protein
MIIATRATTVEDLVSLKFVSGACATVGGMKKAVVYKKRWAAKKSADHRVTQLARSSSSPCGSSTTPALCFGHYKKTQPHRNYLSLPPAQTSYTCFILNLDTNPAILCMILDVWGRRKVWRIKTHPTPLNAPERCREHRSCLNP